MGNHVPLPAVECIDLADEPDFCIGGMRVKPAQRLVLLGSETRELQPRVMQVLVALAQARPAVVSRESLARLCWDGRIVSDDALNRCILMLRQLAEQFRPPPFVIETVPRVGHRLIELVRDAARDDEIPVSRRKTRLTLPATMAAVLVVAALALALLRPWSEPRPPTVFVKPASADAKSSQLAQDVARQLAALPVLRNGKMQLVEPSSADRANLAIAVQATPLSPGSATATLTSSPNRSILWSGNVRAPALPSIALGQRIVFDLALPLSCASEALRAPTPLIGRDVQTYIDACTSLWDLDADIRPLVAILDGLVRKYPDFQAGWASLLAAETNAISFPAFPENAVLRTSLKRHLVEARRRSPNLAEAYIAEHLLAPRGDLALRTRIVDEGVARNPSHADMRSTRSTVLGEIGNINAALREARQAANQAPWSPIIREGYVNALAVAGRVGAAEKELREAERLWPDDSFILMARYRHALRYGDPRDAMRLSRSGVMDSMVAPNQELFLLARINPTPDNVDKVLDHGRRTVRHSPSLITDHIQALATFGRNDELLNLLLNWQRPDPVDQVTSVLFRPAFAEAHHDRRFMRVAHRFGLVQFWHSTDKWPDFCHSPTLTYNCKTEAEKLMQKPRK